MGVWYDIPMFWVDLLKKCRGFNLCSLLILLMSGLAFGVAESSEDSRLEQIASQLEQEIVAPCCWTNVLGEHHSQVAKEVKHQIRALLQEGRSPSEIKQVLADQWGERVLAKPRGIGLNLLVWVVPPLLGLLVLVLVMRYLRSRMIQGGEDEDSVERTNDNAGLQKTKEAIEREIARDWGAQSAESDTENGA